MTTVQRTRLSGVLCVETRRHEDRRGYFMETWNAERYASLGLPGHFVQDNFVLSGRGVLRGLHLQEPHAQGKLVQALRGTIYDVAVDVRRDSPDFGKWVGRVLSADNGRQLYVPEGFAHGYCVLGAEALVAYKCTDVYHPAGQLGIRWDDPDLGIEWPVRRPILSDKDRDAPRLRELAETDLPRLHQNATHALPVGG